DAVAADVVVRVERDEPGAEVRADPPADVAPTGDLVEHPRRVAEVDREQPRAGGAVGQQVAVAQERDLPSVRLDGWRPGVPRPARPLLDGREIAAVAHVGAVHLAAARKPIRSLQIGRGGIEEDAARTLLLDVGVTAVAVAARDLEEAEELTVEP